MIFNICLEYYEYVTMLNKTMYMVLLVKSLKWILFISESTNKANWKGRRRLLAIGS